MKCDILYDETETIQSEDIKEFTRMFLNNVPDYFYTVPASSTGKYHPKYCLGDGGLVRHTKAVIKIFNFMMELNSYNKLFSLREIDCMRSACLLHDTYKQGDGTKNHTVFEHPILVAKEVLKYKHEYLSEAEIKFIARCCVSHMGQWNTNKYSKEILPVPSSTEQQLVHLSDYLASRKEIEVVLK